MIAASAGRESFANNHSDFMFLRMVNVLNDAIDSGMINDHAGFISCRYGD
jgi:hypothetical protein